MMFTTGGFLITAYAFIIFRRICKFNDFIRILCMYVKGADQ